MVECEQGVISTTPACGRPPKASPVLGPGTKTTSSAAIALRPAMRGAVGTYVKLSVPDKCRGYQSIFDVLARDIGG
jgi:hypothetical protein